jgi:predicted dehydrogenase
MVKFGIIGAGKIAHQFTKALLGINEYLYAVASRDLGRAMEFAQIYDIEKYYGSYEELLKDPEVQCVYIATPMSEHYKNMLDCLYAGKHVICEKTFTLNYKEAKIVCNLAKEKGLFLMEAMWTRFLPTIQEVQKVINEGMIGDIVQIESFINLRLDLPLESRIFSKALGGGALLDVGVYPINMANLFLGIPDSFDTEVKFAKTGVDSEEKITYFYPHSHATLYASVINNDKKDTYIYGTKGYVHIPGFWSTETAIVFNNHHKIIKEIEHKHIVNGMEYEIFEAVKCIKKKLIESPIMPHKTTLDIMRQMDEIRKSWDLVYPTEL